MDYPKLSRNLFEKGKVFTLSNLLSFVRLLGAFYLYRVTVQRQLWLTLTVTLLLIISDFADGYLARKFKQVSEMGKVLDPLADKLCVALGIIALYQYYGLPLWITALIIGRDVLIILGSLLLLTRLPYVTPSALPGKITVVILSLLFLSYILEMRPLQTPLQILTLAMLATSAAHYACSFWQKFVREKVSEGKP